MHDGFTLADLVSYEHKHNEANGEDNRDGSDDNVSTNCGVEGPTDDREILALRRQLRRNQLACLFLAQGVPLLLAGDEAGNSQNGNNNAYCQDNETGWVDWSKLGSDDDLTDFVGDLTQAAPALPATQAASLARGQEGGRQLRREMADAGRRPRWTKPTGIFPTDAFSSYVLAAAQDGGEPLFIVLNGADACGRTRRSRMARRRALALRARHRERQPRRQLLRAGRDLACAGTLACWPSRAGRDGCTAFRAAAHRATASRSVCGRRPRATVTLAARPAARDDAERGEWFELHVPEAGAGTRYRFRIDDEMDIPDPASHFQPRGRARAERSDRSRRFRMAGARLARTALGAKRLSRSPCRHVHAEGTLPRDDRAARSSGGDRHHRARADAGGGFSRPLELGL